MLNSTSLDRFQEKYGTKEPERRDLLHPECDSCPAILGEFRYVIGKDSLCLDCALDIAGIEKELIE